MLDPDFAPLVLFDPTGSPPSYFRTSHTLFGADSNDWTRWALEDNAGVAIPGVIAPTIEQVGADISCQYVAQIVPLVYGTATWHMPLFAGLVTTAQLRAAMDAIVAVDATIEYFTFTVSTGVETFNALNACGDRDTAVYGSATPDPDFPPGSWAQIASQLGTGTDEPQRWEIDGSPVDIAVHRDGFWWVGDSWGPITEDGGNDGGLGPDSAWGQLDTADSYLLRPTKLTWPGQDATNTADRIMWHLADVAGDATHHITGQWGHFRGAFFLEVRGWKLVINEIVRHAGSFTIGDPVDGRLLERNPVRGAQLDAFPAAAGNAYDGTTTGVGSSSASDGPGGVVR